MFFRRFSLVSLRNIYTAILMFCNIFVVRGQVTETDLRKFLFKNYDKFQKPVLNYTHPLKLTLHLSLLSIREVDEKSKTLATSMWTAYVWTDDHLKWNISEYGPIQHLRASVQDVWIPGVCLVGELSNKKCLDYDEKGTVAIDNKGSVYYLKATESVLQCSFDVVLFPFDTQICEFRFIQQYEKVHQFIFTNHSKLSLEYYKENGEWEVISASKHIEISPVKGVGEEQSLILSLKIKRRPSFAVIIIMPIFILSIINFLCFLLPIQSGEKMSMTMAVFLTFAIFNRIVLESLPESSDKIPRFAIYLVINVLTSGLTVVMETIVIALFYKEDKIEDQILTDGNQQSSNLKDKSYWKSLALTFEFLFKIFIFTIVIASSIYLIASLL